MQPSGGGYKTPAIPGDVPKHNLLGPSIPRHISLCASTWLFSTMWGTKLPETDTAPAVSSHLESQRQICRRG